MSMSYSEVLAEMLGAVDDKYDKRESSVIYNTLAPAALEFANIYAELDQIADEGFADTASMPFLTRRAAERGITPNEATAAELLGKFNVEIEAGTRFTGLNTTLNYGVYELEKTEGGYYYYRCVCETVGEAGNEYTGNIVPLDGEISGLTTAVLVQITTRGEDAESLEDFRARYFDSINNLSYGGNKAWYVSTVEALDGVGGCKVYPCTTSTGETAGGYVKIVIQGSDYGVPGTDVVDDVQKELDPDGTADGAGLAPIGHIVSVAGVTQKTLDVVLEISCESDTASDTSECETVIADYFAELNKDWANQDGIVVRKSQIMSRCLDIAGIIEVSVTKIGGGTGNYTAAENEIVALGTVTVSTLTGAAE